MDNSPAVINNSPSMVNVSTVGGGESQGMMVNTGLVQDKQNPIIQFTIDNTGVGAVSCKLRIGSVVSRPDAYAYHGLTVGAADNAVITDQFGAGCLAVVGFSAIVSCKPVIVSKIKLITPAASSQLQQALKYRSLQLDGSIDEITANIAYTSEKSDFRANLVEKTGLFVLDAQQFLEYVILAASTVDIFLEVTGFANVETFLPLSKR